MVNETQNSNLQPTGSTANTATNGNPQQLVQGSLQPQTNGTLQPTSNQSANALNTLDQGAVAISLNAIPNSTKTTANTTATTQPISHRSTLVYGGVAVICLAVLAWLVYGILRPPTNARKS
jgi:hypothetical protein